MAGVYIHIPFCKQACYYCNFHFSTSTKLVPALMNGILKEIEWRKNYLEEEPVETIYFGGGTPSIITTQNLQRIIEKIKDTFSVTTTAEITLEANPDDICEDKLIEWREIGINRLSIGIQSFEDADLRWMNRAHTANQSINCLQLATKYFTNISIDLIYGSPTLSNEQWKKNVDYALAFHIPHLSCYALTVETKTVLAIVIDKQKKENIDTNKQAVQFELLMDWLHIAGLEHYEISNFAKPGFRSKHNSSYWNGKLYAGFGPSAHSFNRHSRQWNIANNALYIQSIEKGELNFEKEILSPTQQLNEYIMTRLRTKEGINFLDDQWLATDDTTKNEIILSAKKWETTGDIFFDNNFFCLTNKGKFLADGIAADLFR